MGLAVGGRGEMGYESGEGGSGLRADFIAVFTSSAQ